ncbi:AraC family transcriptional regulator [Streptomyces sp. NA04227]|uniref:AraC family transcriptional regulator n=1 Tax=Streptomyces sp. NA04227 TaxID=2742136 RepID=UPI00158FABD3|nr:AraC family transcriptional regulator [Streptomyces sp. NA04227]QKW11022.1 AraC family transcriptional regulator [Streptomyces sp. NA04227]
MPYLDPTREISAKQEFTVVRNLLDALGDPPGLGLEIGIRYRLTAYGIWGFALLSSPTLRSAIEVGLRYIDLTFSFCRIDMRQDVREGRDEILLVLSAPDVPPELRRFFVERDAGAMQTLRQEIIATPMTLLRSEFAFPAPPPDVQARYDELLGQHVRFGAAENAVAIDPALLDLPLPLANADTAALTRTECRNLLARRHTRTGLAGQVRDALLVELPEPPNAERVAASLHMSARTLRHRLAAEGTSFRTLLDEVREHLAEELLVTGGLTVAEIAGRLGYRDLTGFSHAFRRWKGVGPQAFRTRRRGGSGLRAGA